METIDKAAKFADESVDRVASATNRTAEAFDENEEQPKNAEQQTMSNYRGYIHDNPDHLA